MINYLIGDATKPIKKPAIICHICNDIGAWGAGFVLAISKKWKEPEKRYRGWYKDGVDFELGVIQFVDVEKDITICNMIGQHGIHINNGIQPINYKAVIDCLDELVSFIKNQYQEYTVHMPRIGCGLAGGEWKMIENIINHTLIENNIDVYVYDLRKDY